MFVDEVRNYGIDKNISKLSDKDKKFIILCTDAIKSSNENLVVDKKLIDNTKFIELRNSIISKMVDEKKVSNLYKIFREIKNLFSLLFNKNVIKKVNESAFDKELIKFVDDLKKYRAEHSGERLDFESFLKNRNQNANFTNVNFKFFDYIIKKVSKTGLPPYWGTEIFKNVDFKNIHFDKCDIGYLNFTGSTFENCTFKNCNLNNSVFANVELENVIFTNSLIQDSLFDESKFKNVSFDSSDLGYANFYSSTMENMNFTSCKMTGANLFEVQLKGKNNINDCDLTNCLLFETKKDFNISGGIEHKITQPIVLLPWNVQQPGVMGTKNFGSLKKEHSIPIRFNYFPNNIDTKELDTQVKNQIKFIKENPKEKILSIPEAILRLSKNNPNDNSEILKIISHADKLCKWTNAIMLPGGLDIEPEFYGQTKWKRTKTDPDYRRSLLEFALLEQGREKGIPIMGICRGSQMGNVYYGGTLKQHVSGQLFAIQSYDVKPSKNQGIIRGIAKEGIESYSEHHQAIDKISPELEKVLVYKNKLKIKKKVEL